MAKRRRHALPGDRSSWSDIRRIEFERSRRSFEAAAHAAQQNPHRPEQDWLISYFRNLWSTKRAGYARRRACDIAMYLLEHHGAELMDHPDIATILFCPDDQDPMSFDLEGSIAASRRARLIGDGAFASATMENYAIYSKRYVRHCKSLGLDHLDVQPYVVEDWLALLGHRYAHRTVTNARNAISNLFQKNGRPDLARTERVEQLLAGLLQVKPPNVPTALTSAERYRMISNLESEGLGIRDRVAILICAFSKWGVERASLIDVAHISFTTEGVVFDAGVFKEPFIVGRHEDPHLDLEPWVRNLIALVGGSGPLFQAFDRRRLRFSGERLAPQIFCKAIRDAAKSAGVPAANVTTRLRLLFELECRDVVPDIVLRHYNLLKKQAKATHPDDRANRLKTHRKSGFSIITP